LLGGQIEAIELQELAVMTASLLNAVMVAGVGKRSRKAKNQFGRLLWRKWSISGEYSGR